MKYSQEITLEDVIQADPTFRFFLREAEFEYDKLDWQIQVKGAALVLAINKFLDLKYR
jgi:hypothetical protein